MKNLTTSYQLFVFYYLTFTLHDTEIMHAEGELFESTCNQLTTKSKRHACSVSLLMPNKKVPIHLKLKTHPPKVLRMRIPLINRLIERVKGNSVKSRPLL